MNRKDFFKSIFGGVVASAVALSLLKVKEKPRTKEEFYPFKLNPEGNLGLGISNPNYKLNINDII
jgi:hypothetical protein